MDICIKKAGFMEICGRTRGYECVKKYANNGACILPGNPIDEAGLGGMVLSDQVEKAAAENEWADYIVFDGGTNDAYAPVLDMLGDVSQKSVENGYVCRSISKNR